MTAEYAEKLRGQVVVEGAVDEVFEAGGTAEKNKPTTVQQAREFLSKTGVDIIVPNVGTEHRATAGKVKYLSARAREISSAVGRILCLHGTSSVKSEDLPLLAGDGFIKINIYTTLAVRGGKKLAGVVLDNIGNILEGEELCEYIRKGILNESVCRGATGKPRLDCVANPLRRDAWVEAVRDRCIEFLEIPNYQRFQR